MFNINWLTLILQYLPPGDGTLKAIASSWLYALIKPIIELYNIFMAYRTATLYSLSITGQVIYMEKLLNDKYNMGNQGIYIQDVINMIPIYLFNDSEGIYTYIYNDSENMPVYVYNDAEFIAQTDFIVMVPTAITFDSNEMKSLINLYKLAGKRYTIQTY